MEITASFSLLFLFDAFLKWASEVGTHGSAKTTGKYVLFYFSD